MKGDARRSKVQRLILASLEKLELKDGDIIVVKHPLVAEQLIQMLPQFPDHLRKECAILLAPDGVERIDAEYLRKILAEVETKLEQKSSIILP